MSYLNKDQQIAKLQQQNATQERTIDRLNVSGAAKDKMIERQARVIGNLIRPKKQPETVDEWKALCAKAQAEIEAET